MSSIQTNSSTLRQRTFKSPSFLPNTEPSRHVIRAIPLTRRIAARIEQRLDVLILTQLPPFIALLLLLHNFPCQRRGRGILDAIICVLLAICLRAVRLGFRLVFVGRRLGLGRAVCVCGCGIAVRFFVCILLALLAAWRLLQRVCEALFF